MSTAELENVIMSNEVNDLAAAIRKLLPLIIIFMVIVVGFIIASLYFNYRIHDAIVQKHMLDSMIAAAQNNTAVVPR